MKKIFSIITAFILTLTCSAFAQENQKFYEGLGGKGTTVFIYSSTLVNGEKDGSDKWIAEVVKQNIINDLITYAGINCVDMDEMETIKAIQKKSESMMFDENDPIAIGKILNAKKYLTITTTKTGSSYNGLIKIINAETGAVEGTYPTTKTYVTPEEYAYTSHLEKLPAIINQTFNITINNYGKENIKEEEQKAKEDADTAIQNRKSHEKEEEAKKAKEIAEQKAKDDAAARAKKEAAIAAEKAKKEREAAAAAKAKAAAEQKAKNPFYGSTYTCEIVNGSRTDDYVINFTDTNTCTITVTSTDGSGNQNTISKEGHYTYNDEMMNISANMPNQQIRHIQKIDWKSMVTFSDDYKVFYLNIPVNSIQGAKRVRGAFYLKK